MFVAVLDAEPDGGVDVEAAQFGWVDPVDFFALTAGAQFASGGLGAEAEGEFLAYLTIGEGDDVCGV